MNFVSTDLADSAQLTLVVVLRAKPGETEELGRRLKALVEPTRAEAGCMNYDLHRSREDLDVWMIHENWRTAKDLELHFQMPYLKTFTAHMNEVLVCDMEIRRFGMVT